MIKISQENIIATLLVLGFDKIDPILYYLIEEKIKNTNEFLIEEIQATNNFQKFITFDGNVYQLKTELNLNSDTKLFSCYYPISRFLYDNLINNKLYEFLEHIDYSIIVFAKIQQIQIDKIEWLDCYFCNKEKDIMYEMFGIRRMHFEEEKQKSQNFSLYDKSKENQKTSKLVKNKSNKLLINE